jgi:hypothetical protein
MTYEIDSRWVLTDESTSAVGDTVRTIRGRLDIAGLPSIITLDKPLVEILVLNLSSCDTALDAIGNTQQVNLRQLKGSDWEVVETEGSDGKTRFLTGEQVVGAELAWCDRPAADLYRAVDVYLSTNGEYMLEQVLAGEPTELAIFLGDSFIASPKWGGCGNYPTHIDPGSTEEAERLMQVILDGALDVSLNLVECYVYPP